MFPALTGGLSGGGEGLGNAQGAITIDTSGALQAARTMQQVGQLMERAMQPATRGIQRYERAVQSAVSRGGVDLSNSMRNVGQATEQAMGQVATGGARASRSLNSVRLDLLSTTAALAGIVIAARQGFRALERGAEIQLTAERFDRLARSIGTTGAALEDDLAASTAGMLSDAQQMQLASDLIALSLVKSHDNAVRLSRVVTELNQDIGELVLALSNRTMRRFDQLNVSVEGFDERLRALQGTMSDEEAFTLAFIEQGEEQIRRVGGASQTAAGDLRRLQADWQNLSDDFKLWILGRLEPVAGTASGRFGETIGGVAAENREAAQSYEELIDAIRRTDEVIGTGFMANLVGALDDLQAEEIESIRAAIHMSDSYEQWEADMISIFGSVNMAWETLISDFAVTGELEQIRQLGIDTAEEWYRYERALAAASGADVKFQQSAEGTVRVLRDIEDILADVTLSLDRYAQQLSEIEAFEARREGIDSGDLASRRAQEELAAEFEQGQRRNEVVLEWAEDVQRIERDANAARIQATQQAEAQRTQVIASYNLQRTREEEDFLRNRRRSNLRLQDDIQRIIRERQEQEAKWEEELNARIAEIQAEAARERERMEEDHRDNLLSAASRLDARAVAEENRRFNRQTSRFEEDLQERIDSEREAHQERVQAAREAEEQRIEQMREFHRRRQEEEDEDRAIRLERMEEDHQAQLEALEAAKNARIDQINAQAREKRDALDQAFLKELNQLGLHNDDWLGLQEQRQNDALRLFEAWWDSIDDTIRSSGGATGLGDSGGDQPSRQELEQQSIDLMQQAGWDPRAIYNQTRAFRRWTDDEVARWIERTFGVNVPGYLMGTPFVPRTGLAMLHQGEAVLDPATAAVLRSIAGFNAGRLQGALSGGASRSTGTTVGELHVHIQGSTNMSEAQLTRAIRNGVIDVIREVGK